MPPDAQNDDAIRSCIELLTSDPANDLHETFAANRLWKISCMTPQLAERIGELGGLKALVSLAGRTRSLLVIGECMGALWNCSAHTRNKTLLVELGIVNTLTVVLRHFSGETRIQECVSAIIQNVSESRFRTGERNPYPVRIVEEGALQLVCPLAAKRPPGHPPELETRLRAVLTIANLAVHPQNARAISEAGGEDLIERVVDESRPEHLPDMWRSWLSLMPFVPLLEAPQLAPRYLAVFALSRFSLGARYRRLLWRAFALCGGIGPLTALAAHPVPKARAAHAARAARVRGAQVSALANRVLLNLGVPGLMRAAAVPPDTLADDFRALLRSGDGADVTLLAGARSFRAHRLVLAARCPALAARFSTGAAMGGDAATADLRADVTEAALEAVLEHVYGGGAPLTPQSAAEVLQAADLLGLPSLKAAAEEYIAQSLSEESVWGVLAAAELYGARSLRAACVAFAARHAPPEALAARLADADLDPATAADLRSARAAVEAEAGGARAEREAAGLLGPTQRAGGAGLLAAAAAGGLSEEEREILREREASEGGDPYAEDVEGGAEGSLAGESFGEAAEALGPGDASPPP